MCEVIRWASLTKSSSRNQWQVSWRHDDPLDNGTSCFCLVVIAVWNRPNSWQASFMDIQGVSEGKVSILRGHSIGHSKQKMCMYMCSILKGFRDISLSRRAARHVLTRIAKCIDVDGGIFENVLYQVNCTNFVTWTINTGFRNST
jgi:hypothetical protein